MAIAMYEYWHSPFHNTAVTAAPLLAHYVQIVADFWTTYDRRYFLRMCVVGTTLFIMLYAFNVERMLIYQYLFSNNARILFQLR
jgi:hypothetical protein